jgi:hypothetical protein
MTLDDLGNIGEVVSAIAVVVSLLYLGIQIRQNTRSVRSASFQELLNHIAQVNLRVGENPEVAALYRAANEREFETGSNEELRYRAFVQTTLRHWAHAHIQYKEGTITQDQWNMLTTGLPHVASLPAFKAIWRQVQAGYEPEFRALVSSHSSPPQT